MSELPPLPDAPIARYRHYKGGLYDLVGIARHSESHEPMVVYRPLYGEGALWARPFTMFFESVVHEGQSLPRFSMVGPAGSPSQQELMHTVRRMESALSTSPASQVRDLLDAYRVLVSRFEHDLGEGSRDCWLARASALTLIQDVQQSHRAD